MIIVSSDEGRYVDVGSESIWFSVYSTVEVRLKSIKKEIRHAIHFLETGSCKAMDAYETARQFNLIRDAFAHIKPENAVFNKDDLLLQAPWSNNLSGIVTSCGNLYTTADGKDLLFEVVSILTYAHYMNVDVKVHA